MIGHFAFLMLNDVLSKTSVMSVVSVMSVLSVNCQAKLQKLPMNNESI